MIRRTVLAMAMAVAMAGLSGGAWAGECHDQGKKRCKCADCKECASCKEGKCAECAKDCCKPKAETPAE